MSNNYTCELTLVQTGEDITFESAGWKLYINDVEVVAESNTLIALAIESRKLHNVGLGIQLNGQISLRNYTSTPAKVRVVYDGEYPYNVTLSSPSIAAENTTGTTFVKSLEALLGGYCFAHLAVWPPFQRLNIIDTVGGRVETLYGNRYVLEIDGVAYRDTRVAINDTVDYGSLDAIFEQNRDSLASILGRVPGLAEAYWGFVTGVKNITDAPISFKYYLDETHPVGNNNKAAVSVEDAYLNKGIYVLGDQSNYNNSPDYKEYLGYADSADKVSNELGHSGVLAPFATLMSPLIIDSEVPVEISCADVPNETQAVNLAGLFEVKVDGVVITGGGKDYTDAEIAEYYAANNLDVSEGLPEAGYYWTKDEIDTYFNQNQNELGVITDKHYEISCAGAPTKTAYLTIDGAWDIYVDGRLVCSDVTMIDVIEQLTNEEVIAEVIDIVTPTPEATTQYLESGTLYNIEVDGNIYTNITYDQLKSIAAMSGVEVLPMSNYITE